MKANKRFTIPAAIAISMVGSSAFADVLDDPVMRDEETFGATKVRWDSSFEDLDYTVGETITLIVDWDVVEGNATFAGFVPRQPFFTPKGPDPAEGTEPTTVSVSDSGAATSNGQVTAEFQFTALHCDEELEPEREVGNAHFSLVLNVDTDGDGSTDSEVDLGVNVHVEEPGECNSNTNASGGPPPWAGAGERGR